MNLSKRIMLTVAAALTVLGVSGGVAFATVSSTSPPPARIGCVTGPNRAIEHTYENVPVNFSCPSGFAVGLSGSTATTVTNTPDEYSATLSDSSTVVTGGPAASTAVEVGTITLPAGTYQVSVDAKATPLMTSAVQVFPEFFVYSQDINSNFTGNLFNVGSGALESGGNTNIDSYFNGSGDVTVPAGGETLHVYAFGYDSDRGAGSYTLDGGTVTAIQVTPKS